MKANIHIALLTYLLSSETSITIRSTVRKISSDTEKDRQRKFGEKLFMLTHSLPKSPE